MAAEPSESAAPSDAILTQLRKGVLEYCVLALLRPGPAYGLELAHSLTNRQVLASEGALYPLLSRLRRQGLVETTWAESPSGPPRRYYQLSATGQQALAAFTTTWAPFSANVNEILQESR